MINLKNIFQHKVKATYFVLAILSGGLLSQLSFGAEPEQKIYTKWSIAQFGEPEFTDAPQHLPYANPDALKGGKVVLGAFGSFETLNTYVLKGDWPATIGLVEDSLMMGNYDEIDGMYGLIAETVQYPEDKSWAIFNIRPQARYHDGQPIVAEDFVQTYKVATEHGRPLVKSYFSEVVSAQALSPQQIKFEFSTKHSMKPITVAASMSPLPVHYWKDKDPTAATLEPPLSSGPYQVRAVDQGRSITYQRVDDYWAKDLALMKGLYNFDEIRVEYYRDLTIMFEAFKAGEIDFRAEGSAKRWVTGYDLPEIENGKMIKKTIPFKKPRGLWGYSMNLKRNKLKDIRVREAIMTLYDFEAINRTLLYGLYKRIDSNFPNSAFSGAGVPSEAERAILRPFADQLPDGILDKAFEFPVTDGSGRDRRSKRKALSLFKQAGWELEEGKLLSKETGEQFTLELMLAVPEYQRLAVPFVENLKKMGIDASIRLVDSAQWRTRVHDSDFDLVEGGRTFIVPPGPELKAYFGSASAKIRGGNTSSIENPVVDVLIDQIIAAKDLDTLLNTTRALDRVLLWNHYAVPTYFKDKVWIAYWNKFGMPEKAPKYAVGYLETWWIDPKKERALTE